MSEPLLLALDTSTSSASLALFDGQQVLSESTWLAGREHSKRLLVEVEIVLERIGSAVEELTGLVVARGPGSFTGVRVALSVAKGIADALAIPAWGVSSLHVLALAASPAEMLVLAVVEAGRGRYATALYASGEPLQQPRLVTLDQLVGLISEPMVVIGELRPDARLRLAETVMVVAHP